jgi:CheY-like chemotaxis protein
MGECELPLLLVVDDNHDFLEAVVSLLELTSSYRILSAADGVEALACLQMARPDLIITDISMPNMDGFQLVQALRANHEWRDLSVIFLTALNSSEDVQRALALGIDTYISKPFHPDSLLATVAAFFE